MRGHEETNMNLKRPNSIMPTPARYTGPLEFLTMWMCLSLSPAVLERLRDLQAQEPDWTRLRGHSGQAFRGTGHPSTCVGCAAGHEDT